MPASFARVSPRFTFARAPAATLTPALKWTKTPGKRWVWSDSICGEPAANLVVHSFVNGLSGARWSLIAWSPIRSAMPAGSSGIALDGPSAVEAPAPVLPGALSRATRRCCTERASAAVTASPGGAAAPAAGERATVLPPLPPPSERAKLALPMPAANAPIEPVPVDAGAATGAAPGAATGAAVSWTAAFSGAGDCDMVFRASARLLGQP